MFSLSPVCTGESTGSTCVQQQGARYPCGSRPGVSSAQVITGVDYRLHYCIDRYTARMMRDKHVETSFIIPLANEKPKG